MKTLLLNSTYEPMGVIPWQKAVSLWFSDKVEIIEEYNDFDIKSVSFTMKCPAVVRLISYIRRHRNRVKFSRMNVFGRDKFTCQYCGRQPGTAELTYDHVVPKSRGGKTTWTNIVTACVDCNAHKADRTPKEAKMVLKNEPCIPDKKPVNCLTLNIPKTPESWVSYLYWNQKLDE